MSIVAYIISILTIIISLILVTFTFIPIVNKAIKLNNKKIIIWFTIILGIILLELFSISFSLVGEISEYITPAPSYIWLIFKITSLLVLWFWTYIYFFIWIKFNKNKKA